MQNIPVLSEKLPKYIAAIKGRHSENSKAYYFCKFVEKVFNLSPEDLDLEVSVKSVVKKLKGRVDAVIGNLIIEFKTDLLRDLDDAEAKLKIYLQAYAENFPSVRHLGIANDGIKFRVYLPILENNTVTSLKCIDQIDLEKASSEDVFLWFDSYLFTSVRVIPNSNDLKKRFGSESPTFAIFHKELSELYTKVQNVKHVKIKYDNWQRFLEIIYGDKPDEITLFLKHTYLSAFAKILIDLKISGGKSIKKENVSQIIYGNIFSNAGISNLFEEDFFTWIFYPPLRKSASELIYRLRQQLLIYDLDKVDEDFLKELYQELVDPEQRKLLGEFYTPDWLAETMVNEVLKDNPESSIMDPACGSGTFLFKAIRYKIKALTNKGMEKSAILEHILENVIGFDIHPLAATIAKTNYLLSLKSLLAYRRKGKGSISIPVYLSDSLKLPEKVDAQIDKPTAKVKYETIDNQKFEFPIPIVGDLAKMDEIIEKMRIHAYYYNAQLANSRKKDELYNNLLSSFERSISDIEKHPILCFNK